MSEYDSLPITLLSVPDNFVKFNTWRLEARCREIDTEPFFPENYYESKKIRNICNQCEVIEQCLQDAFMFEDNQYGIRGGTTPRERRRLIKKYNDEYLASLKN